MLWLAMIAVMTQWESPAPPPPQRLEAMPPSNTWDGVAGFDRIRTDPETGQITYPMGQQPRDALTLGCVFGLSNVRCPKPREMPTYDRTASTRVPPPPTDGDDDLGASALDWFGEAYGQSGKPASEDCVTTEPAEGERACTFDEALSRSYQNAPVQAVGKDAPPPAPRNRNGCRQEEDRNADGTVVGVRLICGSGDSRAVDSLRDMLRPPSR